MKKLTYVSKSFPKTNYSDLARKDRKAIAIVMGLLKGDKKRVQLPLATSIDVEADKTVNLDVPSLKRVQWAIFETCSVVFSTEEAHDKNGEVYNVYFANVVTKPYKFLDVDFREAKKNEQKRNNNGNKAKNEAEAKKEAEAKVEAEARLDEAFDNHTVKLISELSVNFGLKLTSEQLSKFEAEILKILHRTE